MSLEAAELRRQEQMLLVCKENLQAAAEKAEALRDGIRQAWRSEETTYLLQALERISSELEQESRLAEALAGDISDTPRPGTSATRRWHRVPPDPGPGRRRYRPERWYPARILLHSGRVSPPSAPG